jgi:hypothetical protein
MIAILSFEDDEPPEPLAIFFRLAPWEPNRKFFLLDPVSLKRGLRSLNLPVESSFSLSARSEVNICWDPGKIPGSGNIKGEEPGGGVYIKGRTMGGTTVEVDGGLSLLKVASALRTRSR